MEPADAGVPKLRRRWLLGASAALGLAAGRVDAGAPFTLCTFGDSILDCARYNERGVHPAQLLLANDDRLFPEFAGRDLRSRRPAQLQHLATDGATVDDLPRQLAGFRRPAGAAAVLITVGGNDLLRGLVSDTGAGMLRFEKSLLGFVRRLPTRPLLVGTVYDPTFGDDARNFVGVPPRTARANLARVNQVLAQLGAREGAVADLHAHFLRGDPSWYVHTIEPSLRGASEVRRVFLPLVLARA